MSRGGLRVDVNTVDPHGWRSKESCGSCGRLVSDDPLNDDGIDSAVLHDPLQACHQALMVRDSGMCKHFHQVRAVNEARAGIHSGLIVCCHGNTQRNVLRTGRLNQHARARGSVEMRSAGSRDASARSRGSFPTRSGSAVR